MSDDLIRRSDAIKAIDDNVNGSDNRLYLKDLIKAIPTIEPTVKCVANLSVDERKVAELVYERLKPKRGKWIDKGDRYWYCSECDTKDTDTWDWCHGCGARMKGADDEL